MKYMEDSELEGLFQMHSLDEDDIEELGLMDESDVYRIWYLVEYHHYNVADAYGTNDYQNVQFYEDMSLEEVARDLVDDGVLFEGVPKDILKFIDYIQVADELLSEYDENIHGVFYYH